jgi:hypothetical protein
MECLRFGSTIPGGYWGCCAADIIQNCKVDPDAPASISLVDGDGGTFMQKFLGKTYREIFESRLRIGSFSTRDMPNHAFFVMLERNQIASGYGQKWMAILKEHGFEFIRTVNNSVWNKDNYVFALFRNNGPNAVGDQFTPPPGWTDLPSVKKEAWELIPERRAEATDERSGCRRPEIWDKIGPAKFYSQTGTRRRRCPDHPRCYPDTVSATGADCPCGGNREIPEGCRCRQAAPDTQRQHVWRGDERTEGEDACAKAGLGGRNEKDRC